MTDNIIPLRPGAFVNGVRGGRGRSPGSGATAGEVEQLIARQDALWALDKRKKKVVFARSQRHQRARTAGVSPAQAASHEIGRGIGNGGPTTRRAFSTHPDPAGARRVDRLVKRRQDPRFSKLRAYAVPVEIRA
jgi:hypothetical protein